MRTWPRVSAAPLRGSGTPTSIRETDLALVEAHFDVLPPGSAWCGYGTCDLDGERCLVLFVNSGGPRVMTLSRCVDATFEIVDEAGAMRLEERLEDFLAGLARLTLLDG